MLIRRGRLALAPVLAAGAAALAPAAAGAAPVTAGALTWAQFNVFDTSAPANTNRTWMGYVTAIAAGTVTASGGARGAAVTPTSPRGADQRFAFDYPATGGTLDAATNTGSIELAGAVVFESRAHGFTITVERPRVVLSGATGLVYASGRGSSSKGAGTYDRSEPLFDLDLRGASTTRGAGGEHVITGIVPALATADRAFPANYAKGSGPDRTPNTFGEFSLALRLGDEPPAPRSATQTVNLRRAPWRGRTPRRIAIYTRGGEKVATGTLRARRLKLSLLGERRRLKGTYYLKRAGSAKRVRVEI